MAKPATYSFAPSIPLNDVSLEGDWTAQADSLVAGKAAAIRIDYQAHDVYLVLSGQGTINVTLGGHPLRRIRVNGYPRLYTLVSGARMTQGLLQLNFSPGLSAYDFTFG